MKSTMSEPYKIRTNSGICAPILPSIQASSQEFSATVIKNYHYLLRWSWWPLDLRWRLRLGVSMPAHENGIQAQQILCEHQRSALRRINERSPVIPHGMGNHS
jgi:hypothetical protein